MGWDIVNKLNLSVIYRDVIYEDILNLEESTISPDHCLIIGGNIKFFIEANKPDASKKVDIKEGFMIDGIRLLYLGAKSL